MFITCLRRLFWALLSLLITSFVIFTLSYYFWIPFDKTLFQKGFATTDEANGLHVFEGFFEWFQDVFNEISGQGETKTSNFLITFFTLLRKTLLLGLPIFIVALVLSFALSWWVVLKRKNVERVFLALTKFVTSIPTLLNVLALLLVLLLVGRRFPTHQSNLESSLIFYLSYGGVIIILFVPLFAKLSLQFWESFNLMLREEFVLNAQARGIRLSIIFRKYIFKNMALKTSSSLFWEFLKLLQFLIVIEQIFGFEGAANIFIYWEQNGKVGLLLLLFLFFGLFYQVGLFLQDIYISIFNGASLDKRQWRIFTLFNWAKAKMFRTKVKRQE